MIKTIFICILSLSVFASDLPESPFWMLSSIEWGPLNDKQKNYYLNHIGVELKKLIPEKSWPNQKLKKIGNDLAQWDDLEDQVNEKCKEKKNLSVCKKLAEIRIKAIDLEARP